MSAVEQVQGTRKAECRECGASLILPGGPREACPFCGGLPADSGAQPYPEAGVVVPFKVGAHEALGKARQWLGQQGLRVPDLGLSNPAGVYLPYWSFQVEGDVRWSGRVRGSRVVRTLHKGWPILALFIILTRKRPEHDDLTVEEREWVEQSGVASVRSRVLLVPGTNSLPESILEKLKYRLRGAGGGGAPLGSYAVALPTVEGEAADEAGRRRGLRAALDGVLAKTRCKPDEVEVEFSREDLRVEGRELWLVPAWVLRFNVQGAGHVIAVNGQTGEVVGEVTRPPHPVFALLKKLTAGILHRG